MAVVSPPFPGDEAARLQALRAYDILDTPPEPAFDQLTRLAACICQAPIALVGRQQRVELEIVVRDTGPGVPGHVRERLFEKFVTGSQGGTGLGRAFCRLAVEAHGGRIWLGDECQGTSIHFTLPARAHQT